LKAYKGYGAAASECFDLAAANHLPGRAGAVLRNSGYLLSSPFERLHSQAFSRRYVHERCAVPGSQIPQIAQIYTDAA
jgi:hypothetical protein